MLREKARFGAGDPACLLELADDDRRRILARRGRVPSSSLSRHVGKRPTPPVPDVEHGAGTEAGPRRRQAGDPHSAPVLAVGIDVDPDLALKAEDRQDRPVLSRAQLGIIGASLGVSPSRLEKLWRPEETAD